MDEELQVAKFQVRTCKNIKWRDIATGHDQGRHIYEWLHTATPKARARKVAQRGSSRSTDGIRTAQDERCPNGVVQQWRRRADRSHCPDEMASSEIGAGIDGSRPLGGATCQPSSAGVCTRYLCVLARRPVSAQIEMDCRDTTYNVFTAERSAFAKIYVILAI
ncbi:hypothetical protein WA026_004103 [Henosepilachna vigintioctopunctata]|uniref:Uncharacterized protein n=1 Tax=Henosepilachna vigintioctopunctata TaxID=420089 RepID=A0AAW1UDN8_9CUCU